MVQVGSTVNVIDNCGAKKAYCIRIIQNSKKKSAHIGDLILVVVKALRKKRRSFSKVKKGEIYTALIVRTKKKMGYPFSDEFFSLENSVVLLNKQQKFVGTRIFGPIPKIFRSTKYMRIFSLSSGSFS
jgi:large subunit ribosomal protein L14